MRVSVPLVDVSALFDADPAGVVGVARQIDRACRTVGFFRITGHGVETERLDQLLGLAREFFELPEDTKAAIAMPRAGPAWRGWFPVGAELTSGVPDGKEGVYFGEELAVDDPSVVAGLPLHGPNLFPEHPSGLRPAVLDWMESMTDLGHRLLSAMALGLGVDDRWFADNVTGRPTTLFRIFAYPPGFASDDDWGVREHTDYGLLTILAQDGTPGLEVHGPSGWAPVPPDREHFVVNLGDMLEAMTRGAYRSTPHRVRNTSGNSRLSLPFFFDPAWDAVPVTVPGAGPASRSRVRWDGADPMAWDGTYGAYLTAKVTKVFPHLLGDTTI